MRTIHDYMASIIAYNAEKILNYRLHPFWLW